MTLATLALALALETGMPADSSRALTDSLGTLPDSSLVGEAPVRPRVARGVPT